MTNDLVASNDSAIDPIPASARSHWLAPALIFAGLEFAIPVLMAGATLIANFSFSTVIFVVLVTMVLQWIGNALQGYMGARLGLPCSVIARRSLGVVQSRIVMGIVIGIMTIGWGALQIEVAGDAVCALVGAECAKGSLAAIAAISAAGIAFAIPAIGGFTSMKWVDIVAVPAGILLVITALTLSLSQFGIEAIGDWAPTPTMTVLQAISLLVGLNVSQWLIASDYTRHSEPKIKDQVLIPLGILSVGIPLLLVGAVMAIGNGEANIVLVMQNLDFPLWGYAILLLALGTSLLVNSYTMGLAIANTFDIHNNRGRAIMTFLGTIVCVVGATTGVVKHFTEYLLFIGVVIPPVVGVMFADFYLLRRQSNGDAVLDGWNQNGFIALAVGVGIGYYMQYVHVFGIPALFSLASALLTYYGLSKATESSHA